MIALLAFGVLMLAAVWLSELAEQSIFSISVLFLFAGFGLGYFDLLDLQAENPLIAELIELALFSVLFTDGMSFSLDEIRSVWRLPGRALLFGMPLTLLTIALLAHLLAGLSWIEALLIGAVLSPTDPVFAAALVRHEGVPLRLRQLLNIESGLNDGLALPAVVVSLRMLEHVDQAFASLLGELALGVALGVAVPYLAVLFMQHFTIAPSASYRPLSALAVATILLALTQLLPANQFLAAFAGGVTIATVSPEMRADFHVLGTSLSEVLKLAALLVFGALIPPDLLLSMPVLVYLFALLTLLIARPLIIGMVLLGSNISWPERAVAAWFGPKGFASIFYGLLVLKHQLSNGDYLIQVIALTIALSIILHSSSDVLVTRWLESVVSSPTSNSRASSTASLE